MRNSGCVRTRGIGGTRHQCIGIGCCGHIRIVRTHCGIMRSSLIDHIGCVCRNSRLIGYNHCVCVRGSGCVNICRVSSARHQCIGVGCCCHICIVCTHCGIMRSSLIGHIGRVCRNSRLISSDHCICVRSSGCVHVRRVGGTRHQRVGIGCCGRGCVVRIHRCIMR